MRDGGGVKHLPQIDRGINVVKVTTEVEVDVGDWVEHNSKVDGGEIDFDRSHWIKMTRVIINDWICKLSLKINYKIQARKNTWQN